MACMVLHNMIIKNEHEDQVEGVELIINIQFNWRLSFEMFRQGTKEIKNANLHFRLHNDLIEYLWTLTLWTDTNKIVDVKMEENSKPLIHLHKDYKDHKHQRRWNKWRMW